MHNIRLSLNPEAAAISLKSLDEKELSDGKSYIVVDAGGGTIDIIAHKIEKGKIRELAPARGGPWGSTFVDEEVLKILKKIFSEAKLEEFLNNLIIKGWQRIYLGI